MEKITRIIGKGSAYIVQALVEGTLDGALDLFGTKGFEIMIDNDFYIIESVLWAAKKEPEFDKIKGITEEQKRIIKAKRLALVRWALQSLAIARKIALGMPGEVIFKNLTLENVKKWIKEKYPDIWKVIEAKGDKAENWLKKEILYDLIPFLRGKK